MFSFTCVDIRAGSQKFRVDYKVPLLRPGIFHVVWISAKKYKITETALFSTDYLWDFNPGLLIFFIFSSQTERKTVCNAKQSNRDLGLPRVWRWTSKGKHFVISHSILLATHEEVMKKIHSFKNDGCENAEGTSCIRYKMDLVNRFSALKTIKIFLTSLPKGGSQVKIASQKKRVRNSLIAFRLRRHDDHAEWRKRVSSSSRQLD